MLLLLRVHNKSDLFFDLLVKNVHSVIIVYEIVHYPRKSISNSNPLPPIPPQYWMVCPWCNLIALCPLRSLLPGCSRRLPSSLSAVRVGQDNSRAFSEIGVHELICSSVLWEIMSHYWEACSKIAVNNARHSVCICWCLWAVCQWVSWLMWHIHSHMLCNLLANYLLPPPLVQLDAATQHHRYSNRTYFLFQFPLIAYSCFWYRKCPRFLNQYENYVR